MDSKTVERKAIEIAKEYFVEKGFDIQKKIQGCDFTAVKEGKRFFVEVKGRSLLLPHITLSRKEGQLDLLS